MKVSRSGLAAAILAAICVVHAPVSASAALTNQELSCSAAVAKNFAKMQTSILKVKARCHADDISGKVDSPDACATLTGKAADSVTKAKDKFVASVAKACASVCSISNDVVCVSDLTCPPKHVASPANNFVAEKCLGKGGTNPFSLSHLDWPGPYCDAALGHPMRDPSDLGTCIASLVDASANDIDANIYAGLDETSGLGADTRKCAASIAKAVQSASSRAYSATASCRDARRSANSNAAPAWACASEDAATIASVQGEIDKLTGAVAKSCIDADIAALTGLCSGGGTTPTTVAEAQACLGAMVREVATEEHGSTRHQYTPVGMLNITHPDSAAPYCGDGLVSSKREEHTGVGEECDGANDAACGAGSCLPPGDVFECTCDTTPRDRFVVNGESTDSDAGWKGSSHDATHNDGFGYVTDLSNCDCSSFSQADCTGSSSDPVCDVHANMAPRCSDDIHGTQTCDQRGNGNGVPENADCFRCDDNSINAGDYCGHGVNADETACQSQCFDNATGVAIVPQHACLTQGDCATGQTCKGRCDNSLTCNTMTEGSPLPQVSAAVSVCIMLEYKTDITGTKNIQTGDSELHYATRSNIQLGTLFTVPCPVCGGVCLGGTNDGENCFGSCNASHDSCLVDSDCTGPGDTACTATSGDCTGGSCSLDLRCSAGPNSGKLCRPDAATPLGVVSHDCPPDSASNLSGSGVQQNFGTVTTGAVEFPVGGACTDPTWHNYDCPCPADAPGITGVPTRPNSCAAACDGGVNAGKGCAAFNGSSGSYTTCVGGSDAGSVCDADSDCEGGTCSGNPTVCTAGSANLIGHVCTTAGDCGGGGVCGDACPGARCVPLCYQQGACVGGARDGDGCATVRDCAECTAGNPLLLGMPCLENSGCDTSFGSGDGVCAPAGGVTCVLDDSEDGLCAAGPTKLRCTGAGFTTLPCSIDTGTCTSGHCTSGDVSLNGHVCTVSADCITNNVPVDKGCESGDDGVLGNADDHEGAGHCEPRPEDCYVNNGYAIGGGTPSEPQLNAAFCCPPNGNPGIDSISGFGGPSRIRRSGSSFVNVPSIP